MTKETTYEIGFTAKFEKRIPLELKKMLGADELKIQKEAIEGTHYKVKVTSTFIIPGDGLPLGAAKRDDLGQKIKELIGADEVRVNRVKAFEMEKEQ